MNEPAAKMAVWDVWLSMIIGVGSGDRERKERAFECLGILIMLHSAPH